MTLQTLTAPAQCYLCHQAKPEELVMVCHHCGRAICQAHQATPIPLEKVWGQRFWSNQEYHRLELAGVSNTTPVHCRDCVSTHHRLLPWLGLRWVRHTPGPFLPILAEGCSVTVEETLTGSITLDGAGRYQAQIQVADEKLAQAQPTGKIEVSVPLQERDRRRLLAYAKRLRQDSSKLAFPIHAGFAQLDNGGKLEFTQLPPDTLFQHGSTLALWSQSSQHKFLTSPAHSHENSWKPTFTYNVKRKVGLPIQLIPTLLDENPTDTLELVVQLRPDLKSMGAFDGATLDKLTLRLPKAPVGSILQKAPPTHDEVITKDGQEWLELTWGGLTLGSADAEPCRLTLRFAQALTEPLELSGDMAVTLNGTFSELKGVKLFYPWGPQREAQPKVTRKSKVNLTFQLQPGAARVPQMISRRIPLEQDGIILHAGVVAQITRELQRHGMYVKKLVMHQPNEYMKVHQREISGRSYIGVYPIDFKILLLYVELTQKINGMDKLAQAHIQVDPTATSANMEPKVNELVEQLTELVQKTLNTAPRVTGTGKA